MRSRATLKPSSKPRRPRQIVIIGIGAAAALAVAFGLRVMVGEPHPKSGAEPEPAAVASIAGRETPTTIIVSTPNSNDCHRYQLNTATGVKNDNGTVKCVSEGDGQPTRIEAISKAFPNS